MMTKIIIVALSLIAIVLIFRCTPPTVISEPTDPKPGDDVTAQNNPNDLLEKTWTVGIIQELDARTTPAEKAPTINFDDSNSVNIALSVNSCMGSYQASATKLKITEEGCTEMCCDNNFDKQLMKLLRAHDFTYILSGNKLTLEGTDAKIVLSAE